MIYLWRMLSMDWPAERGKQFPAPRRKQNASIKE
jgi:hypothetical protein